MDQYLVRLKNNKTKCVVLNQSQLDAVNGLDYLAARSCGLNHDMYMSLIDPDFPVKSEADLFATY